MKIYFEYNLLQRLVDYRDGGVAASTDPRWQPDHEALAHIWGCFEQREIVLTICKEDALEEFREYIRKWAPQKARVYSRIRANLTCRMRRKYDLFQKLHHGALLIAPWGDYGYGCGPYGGGERASYELLGEIRIALGRTDTKNSHQDRDARHLMHSVLYGCDYLLTMDYVVVDKLSRLPRRLAGYLSSRNLKLRVTHPARFRLVWQRVSRSTPTCNEPSGGNRS
ncbi:MAG: hypothetical protein KAX44_07260 [Candidatus Brocadiae bacterium]|nr:hypothetical protein [Candidatus Brocadiia bacterium]